MLKRLSTIKQIGHFVDFTWDDNTPEFDRVNIIFGYNGSGKTTLSNILRLFSSLTEDPEEQLFKDLANNTQSEIELLFNKKLKYSKNVEKRDIYIFNSDFITEHVYNGSKSNCKRFDQSIVTSDSLKNPKIKKLEDDIEAIESENTDINKEIAVLEGSFNEIKTDLGREFNNKIKGSRITANLCIPDSLPDDSEDTLRKQLDKIYSDHSLSQRQDDMRTDISKLDSIVLNKTSIDVNEIIEVLSRNISKISKSNIDSKIRRYEVDNTKNLSINEWLEQGYHLLTHSKNSNNLTCPLCNSDLSDEIGNILDEYQKYFDNNYSVISRQIDDSIDLLRGLIASLNLFENSKSLIETMGSKYIDPKPGGINFDHTKIDRLANKIIGFLNDKKKNISSVYNQDELMSNFNSELKAFNNSVDTLLTIRTKVLDEIKGKSLDSSEITNQAKKVMEKLLHSRYNNSGKKGQIERYHILEKGLKENKDKLGILMSNKRRILADLKSESKYVNKFLKYLGVHNFLIDIQKDKTEDNIQINYLNGSPKNRLHHTLSEGEKTALAFAYYLSKVQYEVIDNKDKDINNTIVIIDDPISSLDENRLYSTARLIYSLFDGAKQLFILSHNMIFLRYMGNIIDKKEKRYYYINSRKNKIEFLELPYGLSNFNTSYFQKFQDIIEYHEGTVDYEVAKKYIPNYIRIVLETFLSFKLAILKQGSSNEKYRSPGLRKLLNEIKSLTHLFSSYKASDDVNSNTVIDKLDNICKTTDPQSHGTPQSIDEFNFISRSELADIAKDTLNIIKFLDNIHYSQTKTKTTNN